MKITLPTGVEIKVNIFTVIKIIRLIRKYIKQHKKTKDIMCFKKMWEWITGQLAEETTTKEPTGSIRKLLTFGKNKYGGGNDLNGCVNDSHNLANKLVSMYPDFEVHKFLDDQVTVANYKAQVGKAISLLSPGATVVVMADSCYSGTITKNPGINEFNGKPIKNRFIQPDLPPREILRKRMFTPREDLRWIVLSGSQPNQTSADAWIDGQYVGAFTYYAIKALQKGLTYKEWVAQIKRYLPSASFSQAPMAEGTDELLSRVVGEGETLIIHNSSHGSYTYDTNGDESDGRDECLYFDRPITDDEIYLLLQKIPL